MALLYGVDTLYEALESNAQIIYDGSTQFTKKPIVSGIMNLI